jgi:hypothetical protein
MKVLEWLGQVVITAALTLCLVWVLLKFEKEPSGTPTTWTSSAPFTTNDAGYFVLHGGQAIYMGDRGGSSYQPDWQAADSFRWQACNVFDQNHIFYLKLGQQVSDHCQPVRILTADGSELRQ